MLIFRPLTETKVSAGEWEQRTKALIRKHASVIKKQLFLSAINLKLRTQNKFLKAEKVTEADLNFENALNSIRF